MGIIIKKISYSIDMISTTDITMTYDTDDTLELTVLCWKRKFTQKFKYDDKDKIPVWLKKEFNISAKYIDRIMGDLNFNRIDILCREFEVEDIPKVLDAQFGYTEELLRKGNFIIVFNRETVIGLLEYKLFEVDGFDVPNNYFIEKITVVPTYDSLLDTGRILIERLMKFAPMPSVFKINVDWDNKIGIAKLSMIGFNPLMIESNGLDKLIMRKYKMWEM